VAALDGVGLTVDAGSCHALVWSNGSGKTTLTRVAAGVVVADRGSVLLDGVDLAGVSPAARVRRGVTRTLQRPAVAPGLTAVDHVLSGLEPRRTAGLLRAGLLTPASRAEQRAALTDALSLLDLVGLRSSAGTVVAALPFSDQRLVQVARALAPRPRVLLLDEPSAGMDERGEQRLRVLLDRLRAGGLTVVLVEHNLRLVRAVADRVTVLDAGRVIADGPVADTLERDDVREAYGVVVG
jgi:branched-chain amino acid transport system ATP-binding protein